MRVADISKMPTLIDEIPSGCKGVHESLLRAPQILEKVKGYLKRGVPSDVVLELIGEMEDYRENI